MVARLTWVGFKEFLIDRFTLKYQKLYEDMNLVEIKLTGFLKAFVRNFNVQMNATPRMDEFANECIFFKWITKVGG